ncbi:MAG TPA: SPOR domain-containing protein [Azoarcus taiwanensis]|nr:SPOR domain-containing protein [Azoarcus taiwanensis]
MADNDNLELKKRSRRRLVGAAALALLAALVLPMIMDDDPGLPTHDIQVTIPDRTADAALARPIGGRPLVLTEDEEFISLPDESLDLREAEEVPAPVVVEPAPVTPPPERAAPESAPAPAPARPAVPETPVASAPAQTPAAPALDEAARVQAILEGRMGATPPASGGFMVQVGAFGERDKAESLRRELVASGYNAVIEQAGGVNRVRVGPYASRQEAERAEARLSAAGRPGVVIAR